MVAVVVMSTACGGDDGGGPADSTSSAPTTTAAPAPTTTAGLGPDADRIEARIGMSGSPDYLVATEEALWVKQDDNTVARIDPATNEVVAVVEVASDDLCQGLGADGDGHVWACAGRDVVRIDPATNTVAATVDTDKIAEQTNLSGAFSATWVLTGDGSTLVGIRDDGVSREIDLGVRCTDLAPETEHGLWLSCLPEDAAVFVDLDQDEVTLRVEGLPGARTIATTEEYAWIGYDDGIARIDINTGERLGTVDLEPGASGDLFGQLQGEANPLWVRTPGFLHRVDSATLEVVDEVVVPEESGGSVFEAFGSIWVTASDDAALFRISPT
jgi:streptogramin lyase